MKEVIKFDFNFFKLSTNDKTKYIKENIKKDDLNIIIDNLIKKNPNILETFNILNNLFKEKSVLIKCQTASIIINSLIEQNKTKYLIDYINTLDTQTLYSVINYEINNKTAFSRLKMCKQLYTQYNIINKKKTINYENNHKNVKLKKCNNKLKQIKKILKKDIKNKKIKWGIGTLITIIVFVFCYILIGYIYVIIIFYNNHVYPNIYLDNKLIEGYSHEHIKEYFEEINNNLDKVVKFTNANDTYEFTYNDIGVSVNTDDLFQDIIVKYQKLNGFSKLVEIFNNNDLNYEIKYNLDSSKYNNFLNFLESEVNLPKKEETFSIVNNNIIYQKGINGFTLNVFGLDILILESIINNKNELNLSGHVDVVSNNLNVIDSKVSSYTTYYDESQGRAQNIKNAVSKLNGKIVYPNEVFSFYDTVGPYGGKGYIFYGNDIGSGVCQVSTTIYNAQLLLNLPIVYRSNHADMVPYVDYGLDATVYGKSVDYKFKNNSKYPIYIEAIANNGNLTISFWSNKNIIENGYTYKPRIERAGVLSYRTFLDTYYKGEYKGTTYLNSSYYRKGK